MSGAVLEVLPTRTLLRLACGHRFKRNGRRQVVRRTHSHALHRSDVPCSPFRDRSLLGDRVLPWDSWLLEEAYVRPGTTFSEVAVIVSGAGTMVTAAALLVALVLTAVRCRSAKPLLLSVLLLVLCMTVVLLQVVYQRPGPSVSAQDWTYPSGHAVVITAAAVTTIAASRSLDSSWRTAIAILSVAGVLAVSASRVALGEHYLIDVVMGVMATVGRG